RARLLLAAGRAGISRGGPAHGRDQPLARARWRGGVQPAGKAHRAAAEHVLGDPAQRPCAGAAEQPADGPRPPLRAARGLVARALAGDAVTRVLPVVNAERRRPAGCEVPSVERKRLCEVQTRSEMWFLRKGPG